MTHPARQRQRICATGLSLLLSGTACAVDFDLEEAIASADSGAVIEVPAGTYGGPLIIDRALTLEGRGQVILDGGGEGDVIQIRAADVTIRGLHDPQHGEEP